MAAKRGKKSSGLAPKMGPKPNKGLSGPVAPPLQKVKKSGRKTK